MDIKKAKEFIDKYNKISTPSKEDDMMYVEALKYVIDETGEAEFLTELGGFYYAQKHFDLALKYYLLGSELGDKYASIGLGYIYYYGRVGEVDYNKAFYYYSKAKDIDEAKLKLSDMYKNGYGTDVNYELSNQLLLELYEKNKNNDNAFCNLPEVELRLSNNYIRKKEYQKALKLLNQAKIYIISRLRYNLFFCDVTNMNSIINNIYKCQEFDKDIMDFYDIIYYFKKPGIVHFCYDFDEYIIIGEANDKQIAINFNNKWYVDVNDFLMKATLDGKRITYLVYDIYEVYGE